MSDGFSIYTIPCLICDHVIEAPTYEEAAAKMNLHSQAVHPDVTRADQIDEARARWFGKGH